MTTSKTDWRTLFSNALHAAAMKAGSDLTGLQWESCDTDRTWGDRCGLVFFGASPEVNERAARFFETWASRNLRKLGVVGGYNAQESVGFVGELVFTRYANGASGWHRYTGRETLDFEALTVTTDYGYTSHPVEMRRGVATSYVYYPCAD